MLHSPAMGAMEGSGHVVAEQASAYAGYTQPGVTFDREPNSWDELTELTNTLHTQMSELEQKLAPVVALPEEKELAEVVPPAYSPLAEQTRALRALSRRFIELHKRIDL